MGFPSLASLLEFVKAIFEPCPSGFVAAVMPKRESAGVIFLAASPGKKNHLWTGRLEKAKLFSSAAEALQATRRFDYSYWGIFDIKTYNTVEKISQELSKLRGQ